MVIRVFRARLKPGKHAEYTRLCRTVSLPLMREQAGCLTTRIGAQRQDAPDDFVVVSVWKDLASIQAFVGERWQEAIIMPGEADMLEAVAVQHFDESYRSLVALWRAVAVTIKRREAVVTTAPLSDPQWERIRQVVPPPNTMGRPRASDRRTLDGILYVLRTGCRWHDLPLHYGSSVTCWRRFRQWEDDGTWERIWAALFATLDARGRLAWALSFLDSGFMPTAASRRGAPTARRRRASASTGATFEMAG